jgi:hypothetical protein
MALVPAPDFYLHRRWDKPGVRNRDHSAKDFLCDRLQPEFENFSSRIRNDLCVNADLHFPPTNWP